ncbi:uncharacterized protein LOC132044937 [Lycium ferocissimum]|uniref:uncharacterized protein LOC132044937 n=1 Tax=Lycium ferocissimum TaxID=112874 RepID=UPI002814988E|nr:uncharacterized protein LOC132044937 [Lycium ferocissimum]
MAPQRLRNINRFDRNRFVSLEADEWEKEAMQYPLIEERGLALTEEDDEQIQPVLTEIEPRRWTKFARNPGPAVLMLVREFYSNMDVTTNASTVRGRTIFFAPSVINRMYETPDLEEEALQALLCNPVWDDEIAPGLCPLGIEWHVDQHGQRDWFPTKNLSLVAKDK